MSDHQGQPPYYPYYPFVVPQQQQATYRAGEPPIRVRVALEFLRHLTDKTAEYAAGNQMSLEWGGAQKLTLRETEAQSEALNLLGRYFRGDLSPDVWERYTMVVNTIGIRAGTPFLCHECGGKAKGCEMCRGAGTLLYPGEER